MVTSGSFCSSDPSPHGFLQVVSFSAQGTRPAVTFSPAAMPAGAELSFGDFQLCSGGQQADFALVNSSFCTCTSTAPQAPPIDGDELQVRCPAGS